MPHPQDQDQNRYIVRTAGAQRFSHTNQLMIEPYRPLSISAPGPA
jgi:hypothetical protein